LYASIISSVTKEIMDAYNFNFKIMDAHNFSFPPKFSENGDFQPLCLKFADVCQKLQLPAPQLFLTHDAADRDRPTPLRCARLSNKLLGTGGGKLPSHAPPFHPLLLLTPNCPVFFFPLTLPSWGRYVSNPAREFGNAVSSQRVVREPAGCQIVSDEF